METLTVQSTHPGRDGRRRVVLSLVLIASALATSCTSTAVGQANPPSSAPSTSTTTTTAFTTSAPTISTIVDELTIGADLEGALLGVSTGLTTAERAPRFRQLEQDADRMFDIGHVFHAWDKPIPTTDDLMHLEDGRLLMISWNGTDTQQIAAGQHDEWIRTQAAAVRDLEQPILLRWLWEMDGNRRRAWVHSGPDYVAAWLHIRQLFDEVGAHNAQFVWCPNEFLFWDGGTPDEWYPGDENVDWLCADGYNWGTSSADADWVSLDDIFGDFITWAAPRNLPIMIGETGAGEAEPGAKAEWIRAIPEVLRTTLSDVDAIVYFDKDFTEFGHRDWRVDSSTESYDAWIEMSNDPWLNPLKR